MPIDLDRETVLTLTNATKHLPPLRRGRKIHVSTLYRWASKGISGVRLETLRLGGTTVTSTEALQRFADRLQRLRDGGAQPPTRPSPDEEAIERELDRRGI
jgi:hypothetical protein